MKLLRYIWASPNTLLGLLFIPFVAATRGHIDIVDGVVEMHGSFVSWFLTRCMPGHGAVTAITLGHVVLGHDRESLAADRDHERVHVRQYELLGPAFLPVYAAAALYGLVTRKGAYRGNFLERQAFRHQEKKMKSVS